MKKIDNKIIVTVILIVAALTATICYVVWLELIYSNMQQILTAPATPSSPIVQGKNYAQILFVGDAMFDRGINYYAQQNNGNNFIFDKIFPTLSRNDLVVANLEGPITNNKSVSSGTTPGSADNYFFTFDPSWAKTLFDKNIRLVDLGNNHILNFGQAGVSSTIKYLQAAGVDYFGAPGDDRNKIKEINGIKIALVSYNEFGLTAQAEQKATLYKISKVRPLADLVVVFSHWGIEYSKIPTSDEINLAHQFVDAGADLVVGSHPHVTQITELYKGKRIYYSLGNFIFDQYFNEDVRNGLGVAVKIDKATKHLDFSEENFYLNSNGQTILK
jgi:poly-gamma-glutamate synthesis protein (capsule biosynthesis protein)